MFICSACVWTCLIFICSFIRPDHRESKRSAPFLRNSTTGGYSPHNLPTEKRTGGLDASARKPSIPWCLSVRVANGKADGRSFLASARKPSIPWTLSVRVASEKADGRSLGTSARKPSISWTLRVRYLLAV